MMWWRPSLLTFSSSIYIIPFFIGLRNGFPIPIVVGLGLATLTSQIYHGSYELKAIRDIIRPIDIWVCHTVVVMHIYYALTICVRQWTLNILTMYGSILYSAVTYWIMDLSRSYNWHAILHIVSGIGSIMFFSERQCMST